MVSLKILTLKCRTQQLSLRKASGLETPAFDTVGLPMCQLWTATKLSCVGIWKLNRIFENLGLSGCSGVNMPAFSPQSCTYTPIVSQYFVACKNTNIHIFLHSDKATLQSHTYKRDQKLEMLSHVFLSLVECIVQDNSTDWKINIQFCHPQVFVIKLNVRKIQSKSSLLDTGPEAESDTFHQVSALEGEMPLQWGGSYKSQM